MFSLLFFCVPHTVNTDLTAINKQKYNDLIYIFIYTIVCKKYGPMYKQCVNLKKFIAVLLF